MAYKVEKVKEAFGEGIKVTDEKNKRTYEQYRCRENVTVKISPPYEAYPQSYLHGVMFVPLDTNEGDFYLFKNLTDKLSSIFKTDIENEKPDYISYLTHELLNKALDNDVNTRVVLKNSTYINQFPTMIEYCQGEGSLLSTFLKTNKKLEEVHYDFGNEKQVSKLSKKADKQFRDLYFSLDTRMIPTNFYFDTYVFEFSRRYELIDMFDQLLAENVDDLESSIEERDGSVISIKKSINPWDFDIEKIEQKVG